MGLGIDITNNNSWVGSLFVRGVELGVMSVSVLVGSFFRQWCGISGMYASVLQSVVVQVFLFCKAD